MVSLIFDLECLDRKLVQYEAICDGQQHRSCHPNTDQLIDRQTRIPFVDLQGLGTRMGRIMAKPIFTQPPSKPSSNLFDASVLAKRIGGDK